MAHTGEPPAPGPNSDGFTLLSVGPGGQVRGTGPTVAGTSVADTTGRVLLVGGGIAAAWVQATVTRVSPASIIARKLTMNFLIVMSPFGQTSPHAALVDDTIEEDLNRYHG